MDPKSTCYNKVKSCSSLNSNLTPPEHLDFADLHWFNFSPLCNDAQVYS